MATLTLFGLTKAKSEFLPENTAFDHLYSEYLALRETLSVEDKAKLERILEPILDARKACKLQWKDIYSFELILLQYWSAAKLQQKVLSLQSIYLSMVGQKAYDVYAALKLSNPSDPPPAPEEPGDSPDVQALRMDATYLLDQIYLRYEAVPAREGLSKWLTIWTALPLLLLLAIAVVLVRIIDYPFQPMSVVFFAGATGGFLSMLQRLKTASPQGDPIYNLTTFWHGAYSLFLSPLSGAIFAVLLYLMFTGNVLQGRFFPIITNPTASASPTPTPTPTPIPKTSSSPPTTTATVLPTVSPTITPTPNPTPSPTATPSPSPLSSSSPSPSVAKGSSTAQTPAAHVGPTLSLSKFLNDSGPTDATDYALLLIWCFIAGFAERFVPDTLTRLVSQADQPGGNGPDKPAGRG